LEELTMTKRPLRASLLLCLFLSSTTVPGLAQASNDPIAKMERAGWKIAQEGVLRRELRPGEVETFVFGVEGFTWKLEDLRRQLRFLRREFKANPTPELRRAIASHRKVIASTLEMIERARTAETLGGAKGPVMICTEPDTINFAYDADTGAKTRSQGTWANASADFSTYSPCGLSEGSAEFSGEVYAYAFAKATVNGAETTMTVVDGPRSGSNVNASADAGRNGGAPCESLAFASVTSTDLNPSSYSKETSSESCLAPSESASTLQATVTSDQPSTFSQSSQACTTITWTVSVSGGTSPYNTRLYLNDSFVGHGTTFSRAICGAPQQVSFRAEVVDRGGQSSSASYTTTIEYFCFQPRPGGPCIEPE
jgi:hypothetical protein